MVAAELMEDGLGLMVVGEEGLSFEVDALPLAEGSMAEKTSNKASAHILVI